MPVLSVESMSKVFQGFELLEGEKGLIGSR